LCRSPEPPYAGAGRRDHLIATFAGFRCLPYAAAIARAQPIGPFNSFSNEDHWVEDPTAAAIVLVGDAVGHNDPGLGQGLSMLSPFPASLIGPEKLPAAAFDRGDDRRAARAMIGFYRSRRTSSTRRRGRCRPLTALPAVGMGFTSSGMMATSALHG